MRVVIITNIPSPYRVTFFDKLSNYPQFIDLTVLYCNNIEANRKWKTPPLNHNYIFLKKGVLNFLGKKVYFNKDVLIKLKKIDPDIVVTSGFNPTMLTAILYAKTKRKYHFINTDAWELTEKKMSFFHKYIRRLFYRRADICLPVSQKGKKNFMRYGVMPTKIFICNYAIDNEEYSKYYNFEKEYDIMFAGQFIERKMPLFFCEIAKQISQQRDLKVLLIGSGPLKKEIISFFDENKINFNYPGFIQQDEIPYWYAKSRILLFPTQEDGWGVVANEACAVGTPVITCENAGVAADLIIHKHNGYILPLCIEEWKFHILHLLDDHQLYNSFSCNCLLRIKNYSAINASQNFIEAIHSISDK